MDPELGLCVVAYTEFVARVCALLLFEAYDNVRLWAVGHDLCCIALELSLEPMLGSMENVNGGTHILGVIEETRFEKLPDRWCLRDEHSSGSVGRTGGGVDHMYYNIAHIRELSENDAYWLIYRDRSSIPDWHPRG